ncbi:MAG: ribosomal protein S18-alanine N-acetyltransferase [Gammaproteobacteria bacterium]|nr:ribosomal protein S18-alanine N-acetyltransferase [Gammaproteobacteria bacterium]
MRYCNLRLMEGDDVPAVFHIERNSYEFPWSKGIFHDCLKAGYDCLVAVEHEQVVGYGIMMIAAVEAHLLNLCIAEQARSAGFARRLLLDLIDTAVAKGAREMYLEVRPSNPVAIALYHSFGFNEVGRRPDYYNASMGREDALILASALPAQSLR